MHPSTIFATPTTSQNTLKLRAARQKRKRAEKLDLTADHHDNEEEHGGVVASPLLAEYTAVVTPAERSQKRLAGLPLNREVPDEPFPHAPIQDGNGEGHLLLNHNPSKRDARTAENRLGFLRDRHMGAVIAILHRSMMCHDYHRAKRALGLILRCEVGGRPVDIRTEGLWGVGAEILFQLPKKKAETSMLRSTSVTITREGFDQAKSYYNTLIIQHPPHKTWPNAVNAIDFLVAMFGLWVYIVHCESTQIPVHSDNDDEDDQSWGEDHGAGNSVSAYDKMEWELGQASRIAETMDNWMKDIIYRDQPELVRLRAMVALRVADLLDDCATLIQQDNPGTHDALDSILDAPPDNVERVYGQSDGVRDPRQLHDDATRSRALGQSLMDKFQGLA